MRRLFAASMIVGAAVVACTLIEDPDSRFDSDGIVQLGRFDALGAPYKLALTERWVVVTLADRLYRLAKDAPGDPELLGDVPGARDLPELAVFGDLLFFCHPDSGLHTIDVNTRHAPALPEVEGKPCSHVTAGRSNLAWVERTITPVTLTKGEQEGFSQIYGDAAADVGATTIVRRAWDAGAVESIVGPVVLDASSIAIGEADDGALYATWDTNGAFLAREVSRPCLGRYQSAFCFVANADEPPSTHPIVEVAAGDGGTVFAFGYNRDVHYVDSTLPCCRLFYERGPLVAPYLRQCADGSNADLPFCVTGAHGNELPSTTSSSAFGYTHVVHGGYVYWILGSDVVRRPLAQATISTHETVTSKLLLPTALGVDDHFLYVLDGSRVVRQPLP